MGGENPLHRTERSVSPVVGVILVVAITVLLAAVIGGFVLGFNDELNKISGNVKVDFEESPVGLEMTVEAISTDAEVRINDETVATINESDTGRTVLLPTAPDDRVTVVSGEDQQSVLVDKRIDDRDEIGDFIAYYTYEDASNADRIMDFSNQQNHLTLNEPSETYTDDGAVDFTTQSGAAENTSLTGPVGVEVSEITVVHAVQVDGPGGGGGDADQLESLHFSFENYGMVLDHRESGHDDYKTLTTSNDGSGGNVAIWQPGEHEFGSFHVYAMTVTPDKTEFYIDGQKMGEATTNDVSVDPRHLHIGSEGHGKEEMDGKAYETRIYHHALDDEAVETTTSLMEQRRN